VNNEAGKEFGSVFEALKSLDTLGWEGLSEKQKSIIVEYGAPKAKGEGIEWGKKNIWDIRLKAYEKSKLNKVISEVSGKFGEEETNKALEKLKEDPNYRHIFENSELMRNALYSI